MTDRDRTMAEITPQELLIRSNPGMFSSEKEIPRDLTNPREMYNILAYKTKSNEDLAARFKQELSKSLNTPGLLPKLSRAVSMNEIRRVSNQLDRSGNKLVQGSISLQATEKKLDVYVLTRHRTCIGNVRKIHEEENETHRSVNLPNITRNESGIVGREDGENKEGSLHKVGLPNVHNKQVDNAAKSSSGLQRKKSASDSKLDKWFSEMPNEVFDKAQRAIMEESIKDRLQRYQDDRSKKIQLYNQHVHVCVGSKMKKLPNTFLELHVDSFGKHLTSDKEDKMNRYKLQQKSMLKLKMRDLESLEKKERSHDELDMMARLAIQPRSLTALALTKSKQSQSAKHMQPDVVKIPTDRGGLKTVNINERVELEHDAKHKAQCYACDVDANGKHDALQDRLNGDLDTVDGPRTASPPPNSAVLQGQEEETHGSAIERETTKATIVTLSLKKDIPTKRKPFHLEKTMVMKINDNVLKSNKTDTVQDNNDEEFTKDVPEEETETKVDKIITKIPTARSNRTLESKSSASSIQSGFKVNKSVLKKFNKLEVFAESTKHPETKMMRKNYQGQKKREFKEIRDEIPPSVRLDLTHIPHQTRTPRKGIGEIVKNEVRRPEVGFRFEPGEVFVTTKKTNTSHTYNNRSSERARIIYGKVMHGKDDRRDIYSRGREDSKESRSCKTLGSTKLDTGRSDFGKYSGRFVEGSYTTYSGREDEGTFNNTFLHIARNPLIEEKKCDINTAMDHVNGHGVMVRDIAIETDIIGTEPNTPNQFLQPPGGSAMRSGSGLTDFIVDNNDGESLDSGSEDERESNTNTSTDKASD